MKDPQEEVKWSRSLALAFSEYNPDHEIRMRMIAALQAAKSAKDLPVWFLNFIKSGVTKN